MSLPLVPLSFGDQLIQEIKSINTAERIALIKRRNIHRLKINDVDWTLLHFVANTGQKEIVKLLIEAGSDVNAQDKLGKTPIMIVVESEPPDCLEVIEILYKACADLHLADKYGKTVVQLVLNELDLRCDKVQKFFLRAVHRECLNNSEITAKKLTELRYPLRQAVLLGNVEVIERMILQGIGVNSCDYDERLTAIGKAIEVSDLEIFKVLIKYGAEVDLRDSNNFHPIFWFGRNSQGSIQEPEIIQILLSKSNFLKDVYQRNIIYQFKTAFEFGNRDVIKTLLEHHDDMLNITDQKGQTALHYLSENPHSNITELLENRIIDVNVSDRIGRTPLFIAANSSLTHINTFKFLLENGADVNVKTKLPYNFDVPLFSLCQNFSITAETYFEIIDMFLQYNLNVQYVGSNETTVFDIILQRNTFYMAKPLLAHLAILDEKTIPIIDCIRNKINSHEAFKKDFDDCKAELSKMKNKIINNKLTLYNVVVDQESDKHILKHCRFSLNSLPTFQKIKKQFHDDNCYYSVVQKRISSIESRIELLHKAALNICKILKAMNSYSISPSDLIVTEIIDYLDTQDLSNLNKI